MKDVQQIKGFILPSPHPWLDVKARANKNWHIRIIFTYNWQIFIDEFFCAPATVRLWTIMNSQINKMITKTNHSSRHTIRHFLLNIKQKDYVTLYEIIEFSLFKISLAGKFETFKSTSRPRSNLKFNFQLYINAMRTVNNDTVLTVLNPLCVSSK
ncbi:hypothetical protein Tsp_02877 [Trichinella spiralis]|uniref:hypothetical protein n=1 Tax=Trichinella spiralis TaxID=6334 RepID=UPI0001EFC99A|nr:hypothetical protein Tsp_02877 [Trichinella spiralis]